MRRVNRWFPFLAVIAGVVFLFGPMLIKGEVLFWGTPLLQFVPWREFALDTLRSGSLPLWNPWLGMGAPLLANYQTAVFYPPNLVFLITGVTWGQGFLVALHLVWAGWGMVLLVRRLGLGQVAQVVAGISFSLSGYLVARASFLSINAAVAWAPWIVLWTDKVTQQVSETGWARATLKEAVGLAILFAFQWLAGHAQMAWYTLLLAASWVIWRAATRGGWNGVVRAVPVFLGAGLLAFVLASAQLLPTTEYLLQSQRASEIDPEFAMTYSFWPWRLLGLLMPNLFGSPATGDFWGYGNYWEDALYIGVLPFLLALGAGISGISGKGGHISLRRFLLAISGLAFILALGKNTPVFPFLFRNIPTFGLFQAPARWNLLLVFSLSILAAIGAEEWRIPTGRGLYWTRLGTVGAAVIGIAAWIGSSLIEGVEPTFIGAFATAGIWLVVSGALTLFQRDTSSSRWLILVSAVLLLDLVSAGRGLNPSIQPSVYQDGGKLLTKLGSSHRTYMSSSTEYTLKFRRTHSFSSFTPDLDWRVVRDMGIPNTTLVDRIPSANNFDPILSSRYQTWMDTLEQLSHSQQLGLLSLMDVGWRASLDSGGDEEVLYEPMEDSRRVRLVPEAIVATSPEMALRMVTSEDFNVDETVILEHSGFPDQTGSSEGTISILDIKDPNKVVLEVQSEAGGWLLLSDTWYPGWQAFLDEGRVEIYRADYLFRTVWTPPGLHRVEFRYVPTSFWLGATLSFIGWLSVGLMVWRWRND